MADNNKMQINIIENGAFHGFNLKIYNDTEVLFEHKYNYDVDASWSETLARWAEDTRQKAIKNNWNHHTTAKPFVINILKEKMIEYNVLKDKIELNGIDEVPLTSKARVKALSDFWNNDIKGEKI